MLEEINTSYCFDHYASTRRTSNHTVFSFRMVWESRHDQGRSNACLIHPELVIVRCYVQYACANHAFPLSQSIHHVNRIENRTKLARCCKCPCLDIPFLAKFVGSRCILGGLLFVLPLLETLKVWGWVINSSLTQLPRSGSLLAQPETEMDFIHGDLHWHTKCLKI
jgi:hypothetical protein